MALPRLLTLPRQVSTAPVLVLVVGAEVPLPMMAAAVVLLNTVRPLQGTLLNCRLAAACVPEPLARRQTLICLLCTAESHSGSTTRPQPFCVPAARSLPAMAEVMNSLGSDGRLPG